jgi:4-hydroxythreonine-4-phosphate dehydrogenase
MAWRHDEGTIHMTEPPLIGITLGDPAGVGPEVVVKALASEPETLPARFFVIGTAKDVQRANSQAGLGRSVRIIEAPADADGDPATVDVLSVGGLEGVEFPFGEHSRAAGAASHAWVECAAQLALDGQIDAIVTAPINKESWQLAGSADVGHQEVFKRLSGADPVATMLVSGVLRCVHLSTHLPLAEAALAVTQERVLRYTKLTDEAFRAWGVEAPRIAVAALNPHASDAGLIGDTEAKEIGPAIAAAVAAGIDASGPIPADSVFNQAIAGDYDVVLVMYHDQGHIAIKVHGFEESISVNLGLPFIRTSVDHGTAFDIAGQNRADATSMVEALKLAIRLARRVGLSAPSD